MHTVNVHEQSFTGRIHESAIKIAVPIYTHAMFRFKGDFKPAPDANAKQVHRDMFREMHEVWGA